MGLGLPASLSASLLALLSATVGWYVLRKSTVFAPLRNGAVLFFAITAAAAPHLGGGLAYIAFSAVVAFILAPKEIEVRQAYFVASILVFPIFYSFRVPFPGLNYLIDLTLWMILVARFLVPLAVRDIKPITVVDALFFAFVFLMFTLDFRGVSITEGVRRGVVTAAWLLVPFLAFRNVMEKSQARDRVWEALLVVSLLLAASNIFIQLVQWDFFFFNRPIGVEVRFGLLRANTTLATGLFGFICATGVLILAHYRTLLRGGRIFRLLVYAMLLLGVLSSGARAAILVLPLMLVIMFMLKVVDPRALGLLAAVSAASHSVVIDLVMRVDFSRFVDPFNIEYRQRLLAISMEQIRQNPLIGDQNFISHPRFLPLIQGQQTIDIVNSYLQIALEYGLPALLAYVGAFLFGIMKLATRIKFVTAARTRCSLLLTVTIGYLFLIATTSMTSYVSLVGIVLLGLIAAETRPEHKQWHATRGNKQRHAVPAASSQPRMLSRTFS